MEAPVLVLGMHRSGTSALTRCVNLLGVPTGRSDDLVPGGEASPKGYWESGLLQRLNDEILAAWDATWYAPPHWTNNWSENSRLADLRQRALAALGEVFPAGQWLWKDSRNCLTLPFWRALLPASPRVVFIWRNPVEVGQSLLRAEGLAPHIGAILWTLYNAAALRNAEGLPMFVVSHDSLMRDSVNVLERLRAFLAKHDVKVEPTVPTEAVRSFLDPGLRHFAADVSDSPEQPQFSCDQRAMVSYLRGLPEEHEAFQLDGLPPGPGQSSYHILDAHRLWRKSKDESEQLRDQLGGQLAEAAERRRELERLVERQTTELAELRSELTELRSDLGGLQARVERLAPLVSIVIICWNNRRFLKRCFDSLMRTDYPNLEIFLADNASADGSAPFVAEHYPSVRVIVNPTNLGFAEGNNRAIRLASGKYVVTLNPDTEVDPSWIRAMVEVAESDGSVGMCSPKMYIMDRGRLLNSAGGDMLLRSGDNLARGFYLEDDGRFDKVEETFGPSAGAGFYRRTMLDDIGLFDKGLFTYYEDVDLNMRAQLRGYRCLYVPEAKVYHYQSGTLDDNNSFKQFLLQRNKWYVVFKDFPLGLIWHCRLDLARGYVGAMRHLRNSGHQGIPHRVHFSLIKKLPQILISRCAVSLRRKSGSTRRISRWMDRHEDTYKELGQAAAVGRYYDDIRKRSHENPAS